VCEAKCMCVRESVCDREGEREIACVCDFAMTREKFYIFFCGTKTQLRFCDFSRVSFEAHILHFKPDVIFS